MQGISINGSAVLKLLYLPPLLRVPAISLALRVASSPTASLSFLVLAVYALKGRVQALQALFLSWLFSMLSPLIAPMAPLASIGRYAVLLAALASVVVHKPEGENSSNAKSIVHLTLLLGTLIAVHSVAFSVVPDVSILKAISWTMAMAVLFSAWSGLSAEQHALMTEQLFGGVSLVLFASVPLLFFQAGYLANVGFQGILGQSQALGLVMALLATWSTLRMLRSVRPSWQLVFITFVSIVMVFLSSARTAALSLLGGVGLSVLLAPLYSKVNAGNPLIGLRSQRVRLIYGVAIATGLLALPLLADKVSTFINKGSGATSVVEAYERSRGGLMNRMLDNISEHPIEGIGFGIASIPAEMIVERDPVFGLPTSATVEKGVFPIAVVEEVGIVGTVFFVFWLWLMVRRCFRRGTEAFAVATVILLLNMGEATFFSVSGVGLLPMVLFAWAATSRMAPGSEA